MKILILTHEFPPFEGGIATYCAEIARAAAENGHQVTVFSPSYGKELEKSDAQNYPFKVVRFKGAIFTPRYDLLFMLWKTYRFLALKKFDLVHAADWAFVFALRLLRHLQFKIPFLASVHGADILGLKTSRFIKFLCCRDMYDYADWICANSAHTKKRLLDASPVLSENKIRVTPLGVNSFWFERAQSEEDIRRRYSIPSHKKIILTVARLVEKKGHRFVFEALASLSSEEKDRLAYVVVGKGDGSYNEKTLFAFGESCGVQTFFTGAISPQSDRTLLLSIYAQADLFCMLTQPPGEAFGLVYLEAAAQGLPAIGANCGGVPEVIEHDKTGILIPSTDARALRDAFRDFLDHPAKWKAMGEHARQRASIFNWQACAELTYKTTV
ncbi:MAG: glycosyltransferase family 4 protein [Verrucomicrobiota bacterium]